jgi:hypothetical protein
VGLADISPVLVVYIKKKGGANHPGSIKWRGLKQALVVSRKRKSAARVRLHSAALRVVGLLGRRSRSAGNEVLKTDGVRLQLLRACGTS